jgi:hypothetical protein
MTFFLTHRNSRKSQKVPLALAAQWSQYHTDSTDLTDFSLCLVSPHKRGRNFCDFCEFLCDFLNHLRDI